ncbi:MAG: cytochrome c1 [Alphaproteobacteria bacterium]|nr:cytochrome c1 [Alphaproteobacteria bacterium]MBF0391617.1 cytochrome c1 [Alphaproteobacteria bacterium]
MRKVIISALTAVGLTAAATGALASGGPAIEKQSWSWQGVFGTYDRGALQRGWQIYSTICASCHSMDLLYYRNLMEIGFTEEQVKTIAAGYEVTDGPNDNGEMFTRPARLSDPLKAPFANEQAARAANNGAYPPDLSLIAKARPGGPDYAYALLTGYKETPPAGFALMEGMYYNEAFPGHQIAMPAQLYEGSVTYADGTPATIEQMGKDIVSFLNFAAQPELEARKALGVKVMLFLLVLTGMMYALKRKIWADVH